MKVSKIIPHENYSLSTAIGQNDIVLYKLDKALDLGKLVKRVWPICLADNTYNSRNLTGRMAVVTGFGREVPDGVPSEVLMEVKTPIVSLKTCKASFTGLSVIINNNSICAGYPAPGKMPCSGDSGGPLSVWSATNVYTQVGIATASYGCTGQGKIIINFKTLNLLMS